MNNSLPINSPLNYVLVHSHSFDIGLKQGKRIYKSIIEANKAELLKFFRTPLSDVSQKLADIPEYELNYLDYGQARRVFDFGSEKVVVNIDSRFSDIDQTCKWIYAVDKVSAIQKSMIEPVVILSTANSKNNNCIFITENSFYFNNEGKFVNEFPQTKMNFMNISDSAIYLDLFFKNKKQYWSGHGRSLGKWMWYWCSMRNKLPYYNVDLTGDYEIINSLSERVVFLLMALDQIGINYYKNPNSHSNEYDLFFNFNYLIILIVGILDNLALLADKKLNINHDYKERINLRDTAFLKKIRSKNTLLREYIKKNKSFINLMHELRNEIVHSKLAQNVTYGGSQIIRGYLLLTYYDVIEKHIHHLKDKPKKNSIFTEWGIFQFHRNSKYLEPLAFSVKSVQYLIPFVNRYFEILGYPLFTGWTNEMRNFAESHLGIMIE